METVEHFHLSRKAKEAVKVGLAFSIVTAISLQWSWMNPYWAGLALGQVALFPAGQSLHNGALRMAGVIPAVFVSLIIYTLAPQERWLFITLVSGWMMFTTYMMIREEKLSYLWNVAGFAALAILASTPESSAGIFYVATGRALDTTMAIIVYTLVTLFIWPDTNIATLKQVTINLLSTQVKIFGLMGSQKDSMEVKKSIKETVGHEAQLLAALKQSFYAKGSETYEVQEAAEFWKEIYALSLQLSQSFNRLNNSLLGLKNIDLHKIVPRLNEYRQEIIGRFELAEDILQKGAREFKIEPVVLDVDEAYLKSLPPFDQLAFASSQKELEKVEQLNRQILECANNIMDDSVIKKMTEPKRQVSIYERLTPDIDHLKSVLFIGSFTFVCFCLWIFFDPPGHMIWMQLPPTIAMLVAATPQMKTNKMVVPCFFIYSFFLLVNLVVMPQLSGMAELAPLLFICMFCVFYFFTGVHKVLGVVGVTTKLMVHNGQTYDFAGSANMIILSVSSYALLYAFSNILGSPQPQRAVLGLIRRYFRSAEFLVSEIQNNRKKGVLRKFKIAFYRHELRTLPLKIKAWSKAINYKDYPESSVDMVEDLLVHIYSISNSTQELLTSSRLQQTELMSQETIEELAQWKKGIEGGFKSYSQDPGSLSSWQIEDALKKYTTAMETLINEHWDHIKLLDITTQEKENLFRLLGSYQGLSYSLISYATAAEQINWQRWEEARFA